MLLLVGVFRHLPYPMTMENQQPQSSPDQQTFILKVLWLAMMGSVGTFAFVAWETSQNPEFVAAEKPMTEILAGLSLVTGILSFVLPNMLLPKKVRDESGKKINIPAQYFVPSVLSFALSESVAIFGLLNTLQTGDFQMFLPFGGAALGLIFFHGMRWLGKIRDQQRQGF